MWVDVDNRSPQQKAHDEAIAKDVEDRLLREHTVEPMLDDILEKLLKERDAAVKKVEDVLRCRAGLERCDEHEVAEFLHRRLCVMNHTSSCSWWYSEWTQKPRSDYLSKARELIDLCRDNKIEPTVVFKIADLLLKPNED